MDLGTTMDSTYLPIRRGKIFKYTPKMKYIDDLRFSNIVNLIQGEEIKGADILNNIAHEMEENNTIIKKLEEDLANAKSRKAVLIEGSQKVLKHLGKSTPLAVQRNGYIVVVTDVNISIERNVL